MNRHIQPKEGEYAPYYENYIGHARSHDLLKILADQIGELETFLAPKDESWFTKPYQQGKWTPKELMGHITDTERIFAYRSLCLARGEKGDLPGFDENAYLTHAVYNTLPVNTLMEDFKISRQSLLSMIRTFPEEAFTRSTNINGHLMSCRACLAIIPGHFIHHMNILKERY